MPGGSGNIFGFLTSFNLVESVLKILDFRHKREQDRQFRDPAEALKLALENEGRALDNIKKRLDTGFDASDLVCSRAILRSASYSAARHVGNDTIRLRHPQVFTPCVPAATQAYGGGGGDDQAQYYASWWNMMNYMPGLAEAFLESIDSIPVGGDPYSVDETITYE